MSISPEQARAYASAIESWGNLGRDPEHYYFRLPIGTLRGLDVPGGVIQDLADSIEQAGGTLPATVRAYARAIESWSNGRDPKHFYARLPQALVQGLNVPAAVVRDLADELERAQTPRFRR